MRSTHVLSVVQYCVLGFSLILASMFVSLNDYYTNFVKTGRQYLYVSLKVIKPLVGSASRFM